MGVGGKEGGRVGGWVGVGGGAGFVLTMPATGLLWAVGRGGGSGTALSFIIFKCGPNLQA